MNYYTDVQEDTLLTTTNVNVQSFVQERCQILPALVVLFLFGLLLFPFCTSPIYEQVSNFTNLRKCAVVHMCICIEGFYLDKFFVGDKVCLTVIYWQGWRVVCCLLLTYSVL